MQEQKRQLNRVRPKRNYYKEPIRAYKRASSETKEIDATEEDIRSAKRLKEDDKDSMDPWIAPLQESRVDDQDEDDIFNTSFIPDDWFRRNHQTVSPLSPLQAISLSDTEFPDDVFFSDDFQ